MITHYTQAFLTLLLWHVLLWYYVSYVRSKSTRQKSVLLSASLLWEIFSLCERMPVIAEEVLWHVYNIPWRECLLLFLCVLLRAGLKPYGRHLNGRLGWIWNLFVLLSNLWEVIRNLTTDYKTLGKRNSREIIYVFSSQNLKLLSERSLIPTTMVVQPAVIPNLLFLAYCQPAII